MRLFNTLTRQTEELTPLTKHTVSLYSCGPTVYDHIHIGNLSSFIYADTLRRVLQANGNDVKHVMNFTDIDDKTIRRSQKKYADLAPLPALMKLTNEYAEIFLEDMRAVGNDVQAMIFVKATDSIDHMRALITTLHENGFAYIADDGVYFSLDAYRKSGKTYGQLTEITSASTAGSRIQNDEYGKDSAHDFALWKKQKSGEPAWEFDIAGHDLRGRPGWHIECSVMSSSNLGQPFDIHTGGVDLIFPHHENEIAQSTAGTPNPTYAACFVHNEHLLVDGQKMSKSLQNFYTITDITDKGYDPLAFRLLVLQSHYRHRAHFSWDNLAAAQNRLKDLKAMAVLRWQARKNIFDAGTYVPDEIGQNLTDIAADDLNAPAALAVLSKLSSQYQATLLEEDDNDRFNGLVNFNKLLEVIDRLFGLELLSEPDITDDQKQVIAEREQARNNQDWSESDRLRHQLAKQGIGLRDTPSGAIWFRS